MIDSPVMGIDPSLNNTAYCFLGVQEQPKTCKIRVGKKKGVPRLLHIERNIEPLLLSYQPELIVIEGYSYASTNQAHQTGELGGILRRMFHIYGVRWIEVAPPILKKFITGKGNADKNLVLLNVYKRWGLDLKSDDEADAFGLAKIGTYLLGADDSDLIRPQQEALKKIREKMKEGLL